MSICPKDVRLLSTHIANFLKEKCAASENKTLCIHTDKDFSENPLERVDVEETLEVQSIEDMDSVLLSLNQQTCGNLELVIVPVTEDKMPSYECFDIILNTLRNEPAYVPCIFTCQMGKGRTTAGMVITSLIKEMVIVKDLR